jgi:hypothetical protein
MSIYLFLDFYTSSRQENQQYLLLNKTEIGKHFARYLPVRLARAKQGQVEFWLKDQPQPPFSGPFLGVVRPLRFIID